MTNKEKYAKEIVELACNESDIAVSKATGNPIDCSIIECDCCALYEGGTYNDDTCRGALRKWVESEYVEKLVISKTDRAFLEYVDKKFAYITRSSNNNLYLFVVEPIKNQAIWTSGYLNAILDSFNIDFPMVKWEDDKPWLIEDLKKLEVVEEYEK